jgi:hypothetical protein
MNRDSDVATEKLMEDLLRDLAVRVGLTESQSKERRFQSCRNLSQVGKFRLAACDVGIERR